MTAVVAYLLVVGVLVAVAARAAEELLRLAGRPTRWAWAGGLLLLPALAAWAPLQSHAPVGMPVRALVVGDAAPLPAADAPGLLAGLGTRLAAAWAAAGEAPAALIVALGEFVPPAVREAFGPAWGVMSVVLAALLAFAYVTFTRRVARLPIAELHGEPVHVSPTAGPAVLGLVRPRIVVPAWLLAATPDEQRLAIVHEREHLAARDPLLLVAGCVAVALLPWHPASWWMLSRLRLAVEMDCDRRVLARGIARRTYGAALVDIAARCARLPLGAPALADHTTHLERRLIAMTPAPITFRRTRTLAVGAAALLAFAAACEARLPSSPEIERMDVAALERNSMAKVAMAGDTSRVYMIDGKVATAAEANALAAEEIATVQINRSRVAGEQSVISIVTRKAVEAGEATASETPLPAGALRFRTEEGKTVTMLPSKQPVGAPEGFTGVIYIDGVKSDQAALARLSPARIEQIEVIKGAAAVRAYSEPEAANGVIRVVTKRAP